MVMIPAECILMVELEAKDRAEARSKPAWECAARRQSLPETADCNWPTCTCDPYANKVIDALHEQGLLKD